MADDERFLPQTELRKRYSVSHMWIERRMKDDPKFPKPIYMGRNRFWRLSDLEKYERHCAKQREVA